MLINSLMTVLGNPTSHLKNQTLLTRHFFQVTRDPDRNCVLLHSLRESTPVALFLAAGAPSVTADTLVLDLPWTLADLMTAVQSALRWDYAASQAFEQLQVTLPSHPTLQDYLDRFSRQFDQSLVLFNHQQQVLLSSATGPLSQLSVASLTQRLLPTLANVTESVLLTTTDHTRLAAVTLTANYTLTMTVTASRPAAFTLGLLHRLGGLLQQRLTRLANQSPRLVGTPATAHFSSMLLDLIHSKTVNTTALADWQISADHPAYLLQLTFKRQLDSVMITDFLNLVVPLVADVRYCLENTAMILSCRPSQPLNTLPATLKILYHYAQQYDFNIAISMPFTAVEQVSAAYHQCIAVQAYAVTVPLPERILFYQDVALLDLVDQVKGRVNLNDYVHPDLQYLMTYDQQHQTDYLNTLHLYLYHDKNARQAAADLHIHPNTLLYRIGKIKKLLAYDFSFGKQNLDYRMGCLILYSQNKLPLPHARHLPPEK